MTSVKYEQTISLGTMITLIGLAISVAVSFALTQADVASIKGRLEKVETTISGMPTQMQTIAAVDALARDNAARVRVIETQSAGMVVQTSNMAQTINEMRDEVKQTNDLVRRLLARESGSGR